jgi:hypothetical protein
MNAEPQSAEAVTVADRDWLQRTRVWYKTKDVRRGGIRARRTYDSIESDALTSHNIYLAAVEIGSVALA